MNGNPWLRLLLVAFLMTVVMLIITRPADAGGIVTNCSNDSDFSSKLAGGGAVTFNCGAAIIVLSGSKTISADTAIDGGGMITLSGGNADRLFVVNTGVTLTLNNIVLTNGYSAGDGGAIYNSGHLVLNKTTIQNSESASGSGGAIVTYGPLDITNSTLANNKAANGGAIYPRYSGAQVTITRSALHDNQTTSTTDGWGGAILLWDGAAVSILNSDLYSNSAREGGAIFNNFANSSMSLQDTQVRNNKALFDFGGGIYNENGTATLTDVTLSGNSTAVPSGPYKPSGGGAIYNYRGTVTLTDATLSANSVLDDAGGGIRNDLGGTITLTNVTLSGNSAFQGGGIYNAGTASRSTPPW